MASVSNEGQNIITVQVQGDNLGDEIAVLDFRVGLYGHGDADTHLIWAGSAGLLAGIKSDSQASGHTLSDLSLRFPVKHRPTQHQ